MRTFRYFPEGIACIVCGRSDNKECTLIPIDGPSDGGNCEATPVHVDCITGMDFRYSKDANIIYRVLK